MKEIDRSLLVTPEQIKQRPYEGFKFVKLSTGEWRFWLVDIGSPSHKQMVQEGEKATDAGLIVVRDGHLIMEDSYSSTLELSATEEGWEELSRLFGMDIKPRWF